MTPGCFERSAPAASSELIWETDDQCTVQAGEVALPAGDRQAWTPDLFVAVGVAASVMSGFFRLAPAAGLTVLAYASQQRIERVPQPDRFEIIVAPCITVSNADQAVLAQAVFNRAVAESPLAGILRFPARFEPHIVALPEDETDSNL